jgi:transposase
MSRSKRSSLSLEERAQIVLAVLRGEVSVAEAARRHGVAPTSVAKWRDRFIDAGRQGLELGVPGVKRQGETVEERRLRAEAEELKLALAEATVQLRIWQRGAQYADRVSSQTSKP